MKWLQYGMPVNACHEFYNDFTLFQHYQILFLMYTDKDSNLIRNQWLSCQMVILEFPSSVEGKLELLPFLCSKVHIKLCTS